MKSILSTFLSCILLLQPTVFAYSPSTGGGTSLDASNRERSSVADQLDTSFFQIPRLSVAAVRKDCERDLRKLQFCQETFKDIKELSEGNVGLFSWCSAKFGKDFKNNPREMCRMYEKYGIHRAEAWHAYERYYNEEEGAYGSMSPVELYSKYEQVSKDIAILWDINPEYKTKKREDFVNKLLTATIITVIAIAAGELLAPMLESMGFSMMAQMSSLTLVRTKGLVTPLRFAIQRADVRFLLDLAFAGGYMYMDTIFVESAYSVLNDLTEELQEYIQEHVNVAYEVDMHNLLLKALKSNLTEEVKKELKKNKDEVYNLDQQLRVKVKEALKQGWGEDTMLKREAVVTLYALEYIRAEMADKGDFHRYREAGLDLVKIYEGKKLYEKEKQKKGGLTNLHKDRNEVYRVAKEAYEIRMAIEAERRRKANKLPEQVSNEIVTGISEQVFN